MMLRRLALVLVMLAVLSACDRFAVPQPEITTTTFDGILPPPDIGPPPTPTSSTTTISDLNPTRTYTGYLPNGSDFIVNMPGPTLESVNTVGGWFIYAGASGLVPVGDVHYRPIPAAGVPNTYDNGLLRLAQESWIVEVFFRSEVLVELGDDAEEIITRSVTLEVIDGWPVIRLSSPFTWGVASPVRPTVGFDRFLVRDGCDTSAVRCSDNQVVQILALEDGEPGAPPLPQEDRDGAWIETSADRPPLSSSYFNTGPLSRRVAAQLMWTGEEMIVWGGKTSRDGIPDIVDGAAFDPHTNQWRLLAGSPIEGPVPNRAIWAGEEMVVVTSEGAYGYDPVADNWRNIGDGRTPSEWPGRLAYTTDGLVYLWSSSSVIDVLEVESGTWTTVPSPDRNQSGSSSQYEGVLLSNGDDVVAVVLRGSCDGKDIYLLDGEVWQQLPETSLGTSEYSDCSTAYQSAFLSDSIYLWDDEHHPTMAMSVVQNKWRELEPIPLAGAEGPSGPVVLDDEHFLVPLWEGQAAIFDAGEDIWRPVRLPGDASDTEMVWTGDELLAWGVWGTFDSWRWSPPQALFIGGGDDTR